MIQRHRGGHREQCNWWCGVLKMWSLPSFGSDTVSTHRIRASSGWRRRRTRRYLEGFAVTPRNRSLKISAEIDSATSVSSSDENKGSDRADLTGIALLSIVHVLIVSSLYYWRAVHSVQASRSLSANSSTRRSSSCSRRWRSPDER